MRLLGFPKTSLYRTTYGRFLHPSGENTAILPISDLGTGITLNRRLAGGQENIALPAATAFAPTA